MSEFEEIFALRQRVAKLERALEFLLQHLAVEFDDSEAETVDPEILRLAREGRTIEAINLYRKQTGVGLAEAKKYIDEIARG